MNFFKPDFWDKNKISIFSILLMPIAFLVKCMNVKFLLFVLEIYILVAQEKNK